ALAPTEIQLLTNNVVPGLAAPAIPLNSPVSLAAGTRLDVNGYLATVTNLTGSGTVNHSINGSILAANYGADATFNGVITNTPAVGTLTFIKTGPGTMTVGSGGLIANNTVVGRDGKLTFSGTGLLTTNGAANTVRIGEGVGRAILDIPPGTTNVIFNLVLGGEIAGGRPTSGGGAGVVYNRGTYINYGSVGVGAFAIGNATGGTTPANNAYGYFLNDTPNLTALGESGIGGQLGGDGVFEVKQGTVNFTNWITMGRLDATYSTLTTPASQRSLMLIRNGTVNGPNFVSEDRWNWQGTVINFYTVMDIGAGGILDSLGINHNINMGNDNDPTAISILTIDNGGLARVNNINAGAVNPNCTVNFNGATLAPM